jgi:threonine dehydratase
MTKERIHLYDSTLRDGALKKQLFTEIARARTRIYTIGSATPIKEIPIPGIDARIFIKREDLSTINSYKWRGAYNCMAALKESKNIKTVVTASAGNHAQGVAIAARMLGIKAFIFMPLPTPLMKQHAVKLHGGEHVEIILSGDTFDEVSAQAKDYCAKNNFTYVHAFDDIHTIAGQAMIGEELAQASEAPFDYVFLQIGGGGLAAGVASVLREQKAAAHILGVEGINQASMKASIEAGHPVTLTEIDTFCDGTAVKRPGDLTFEICKETLEGILTVSNEEVSAAIRQLWDCCRTIPEPSGAMGLAGLIQFAQANPEKIRGKKLLAIHCGANMDFSKLAIIANQSAVGSHRRRYLRIHISEQRGGMLKLLENIFPDVTVSEFQYGKVGETDAWPVIAFEASPARIAKLFEDLRARNIPYEDVTGDADVRYRIIPLNPQIFSHPLFFHVHFPERSGALRDFMRLISDVANVCYFNYTYSGEVIGRALMGFEFGSIDDRDRFLHILGESPVTCRPVAAPVLNRLLSM